MNKNITYNLLALLLFCTIPSFAQSNKALQPFVCGTVGHRNPASHHINIVPSTPTSCYYIKVYFHFIRHTDGSGGLPVNDIDQIMTNLNNGFNPQHIVIVNGGNDEIRNDYYVDFNDTKFNQLIGVNNQSGALNIYLLANDPAQYDGRGDGIPGHSLVIAIDFALTNVVVHEMGHLLNLYHTHHGSVDAPEGGCLEKIDESNCSICGDSVCDTPADPDLAGVVDNHCNYIGTELQDGQPYHPDTHNFMSYSLPACLTEFTNGQGQRMRTALSNESILQPVKTQPDITFSSPDLCSSTTVSLINVSPGVNPTWNSSPAGLANVPSSGNPIQITRVGSSTGTLTLTVSFDDPCGNYSFTKSINVGTPIPGLTIQGVSPYGGVDALVQTSIPPTYDWYVDNVYKTTTYSTSATVPAGSCGWHLLSVHVTNSCGTASSDNRPEHWFNYPCSHVIISPNPAQTVITTTIISQKQNPKFQEYSTGQYNNGVISNIKSIRIYSASGKLSKQKQFSGNSMRVQIDISKLSNGIYFVEISDGKNTETQKLVISR